MPNLRNGSKGRIRTRGHLIASPAFYHWANRCSQVCWHWTGRCSEVCWYWTVRCSEVCRHWTGRCSEVCWLLQVLPWLPCYSSSRLYSPQTPPGLATNNSFWSVLQLFFFFLGPIWGRRIEFSFSTFSGIMLLLSFMSSYNISPPQFRSSTGLDIKDRHYTRNFF